MIKWEYVFIVIEPELLENEKYSEAIDTKYRIVIKIISIILIKLYIILLTLMNL